jgi:acetylornithine deacetylase
VLRARVHPLVGPASQHVATVAGGAGWSTYAERCAVRIERRTLPGEDADAVRREIEELAAAHAPGAEVELVLARPPLLCDRRAEIAVATRAAMREVTGREPRETGVGYWMDAALFAAAGIPTVDVGPTGGGAHERVEWVEVASLVETASILIATARRFVAGG